MPELPEVETVMRGLSPFMQGHKMTRLIVNRFDLRKPIPNNFVTQFAGVKITSLKRRAKYIIIECDNQRAMILHLGMSGRMRTYADQQDYQPRTHDHVLFDMDNGARIAFEDPRRFGMLYDAPLDSWSAEAPFADMAPEPLGNHFHADYLRETLKSRKVAIKQALLNQSLVVGLGNIYVCEALYRARISPLRESRSLDAEDCTRLTCHIKDVLRDAIEAGGSTLKDYQHTDGSLGYFQHRFDVYDREGQPCKSGEGVVKRCVQSGRSTFYCPQCQI